MAFVKKTWKDRLVEFAGRRSLTKVSGDIDSAIIVDVTRSEGEISQAGDTLSAENMNDLEGRIWDAFQEVSAKIYPVGAVYMSFDPTDPAELFGGTWEQIEGRFLLGACEEYPVDSIGGEPTHTLINPEMPSHSHTISGVSPTSHTPAAGGNSYYLPFSDVMSVSTNTTGGGQPHNNMPPYMAVYMWRRVE